jgi:hypothetical protein
MKILKCITVVIFMMTVAADAYAQGACPDTANVGSGLQQINVPAGSNVVVLVTRAKNEASMVEVCSGDGAALQQRRREEVDL